MLPLVSVGIMDASATRSRRTPKTRKRWSTTADGSNGREKGDRTENVARDTGPPPYPWARAFTACYAHFGSSNGVINGQCHETAGVIRSNTVVRNLRGTRKVQNQAGCMRTAFNTVNQPQAITPRISSYRAYSAQNSRVPTPSRGPKSLEKDCHRST